MHLKFEACFNIDLKEQVVFGECFKRLNLGSLTSCQELCPALSWQPLREATKLGLQ